MAQLITLTEEQKKVAIENCLAMDLLELTRLVFKDPKLDGRSIEGKSLKAFLAGENITVKTTENIPRADTLALTDEQKKFIDEHVNDTKPLELTRLIFKNEQLTPLNREFRIVYNYIKDNNPWVSNKNDEVVEDQEYKAPPSIPALINKLNQYLPTGDSSYTRYDSKKLTNLEEKCLKTLLSYVKSPIFSYQATQYQKAVDRELFEAHFMRFTHDKDDLTAEEIHQYISLSAEIVNTAQIERSIQKLDQEVNDMLEGDDNDTKKMSMSMVELVNALRSKWEASKERQKKLLADLTETRSSRLKNKLDRNASILNLVEAWMKEKDRKEMIELGELEKKADVDEVNRLASMDDVVALIAGMTKEEAAN